MGGRCCQAPQTAAVPLASKEYIGGVVECGALCHPVVNRYKRGLTGGSSPVRCWQHGSAADVPSTESPCSTVTLPWLLLIPWLRPLPKVDRHPPPGGIAHRALQGSPRPNAPHFSGALGALVTRWSPGLQRLPWIPLSLGWCLVRLRPTAPLNSPPRRRGIPSPLRSVGIHEEKEGMCVLGGWRAAVRPGIRGGPWIDGCYGSTREIIRSITKRACGGGVFQG